MFENFHNFLCAIGNKMLNYTLSLFQLHMEFSRSTEISEWDMRLLKPLENPLF